MSDIEIHLVCGKYTRSIKVTIDNRCKVVNFEGNYPELKHTIWWKALFVSDIYILCDDFVVNLRKSNYSHKSTSSNTDTDFHVRNVANKDCIVCENGEALSREQIIEIKNMLVLHSDYQKVTSIELDIYVLKVIYCYILPFLVFTQTDLDWLHWCLKLVEDELQKVDTDLIKDDKHLVKFVTKLREKRAAFRELSEAQKKTLLMTGNAKFLDMIISHLKDDCLSLEEVYNTSRARVQNLKGRLKEESLKQNEEEYEEESEVERDLYFEREESNRIWEEMVALKINIANMDYLRENAHRSQNKRNIKDTSSLPHKYLELHELREGLKKKVKDSCLDKLRLKAIAEDIKMAIHEVENFGESLKIENDDNKEELKSFDTTNELGSACWLNCAEKVKCLLRDHDQYLSQVHQSFKGELHLKISSLLSEQTLFQNSPINEINHDSVCDISSSNSEGSVQELDIFNPFSDHWAGIIQQLKDRIFEQMTKMCQMLKSSMFTLEKSEQKQIPKIYENILLSEIMDDMHKLFETGLKMYSNELYTRISSLSERDLIENIAFLNNGGKESDKNDIHNGTISPPKEGISQANFTKTLCKSNSVPEFSKEGSRNSILISQKSKKFQDWTASYGSSLSDYVSSAFLKRSVSSLYKEADIEYRVFCKEKTRPVAMHEVECLSNNTSNEKDGKKQPICFKNVGTFLNSFHSSLLSIEKFFSSNTFQGKINCMVRTLKCISYSFINNENRLVTADDLIGILSVLFYSLSEEQVKRLCCDLTLINTFMAQDEQMSLGGNALVHFLCAFEALYRQAV